MIESYILLVNYKFSRISFYNIIIRDFHRKQIFIQKIKLRDHRKIKLSRNLHCIALIEFWMKLEFIFVWHAFIKF